MNAPVTRQHDRARLARRRDGFAIVTRKATTGADVIFSIVPTEGEASGIVERLKAIGCPARVERARAGDVPGLQRRP